MKLDTERYTYIDPGALERELRKSEQQRHSPEYVPVMVELCPAARIPTAQMYLEGPPNAHPRYSPAEYRSRDVASGHGGV